MGQSDTKGDWPWDQYVSDVLACDVFRQREDADIMDTVYRLNTFPLIHKGFLHMFFNTICLVPLMERFEAEHGTLNTLALFMGRKCWALGQRQRVQRC
jgi:membrane associated rhomboid family serine protease